jgi:hypothetical protein
VVAVSFAGTILTSFRNPRDRQALVTSLLALAFFCLIWRLFSCSYFAASNRSATVEYSLQRVVTPVLNWELWGRAYLLFVRIAGEILPSLAGLN